jgi:hypothetical protein
MPICTFSNIAKQELQILNELNFTIIYTDASTHVNGKTGVGIYIDDKTTWHHRLSDNISIFPAEMIAIKLALIVAISGQFKFRFLKHDVISPPSNRRVLKHSIVDPVIGQF